MPLLSTVFTAIVYVLILTRLYTKAGSENNPIAALLILFLILAALTKIPRVFVKWFLRLLPGKTVVLWVPPRLVLGIVLKNLIAIKGLAKLVSEVRGNFILCQTLYDGINNSIFFSQRVF